MLELLIKIFKSVVVSLYQELGAALLTTILALFVFLYMKEHGLKKGIIIFAENVRFNRRFRYLGWLFLYTALILFRTLFCRAVYVYPLSNVIGNWKLYDINGQLYTENIENLLLFIPFGYLCLLNIRKDVPVHYVRKALKYTALFSCGIEVFQILLRVGTFQISDLFFNILGGALGGVIYWIVRGVGIIPKDSDI